MIEGRLPSLLKIVIVDDSLIVLERLRQMLSDMETIELSGYARNINAAVQLINEKSPHAVLLDIHLANDAPHKNGMDLLSTLRSEYPDLIIIMLTNLIESHYKNKCMQLGANYFFDKSNDFEKIPQTLMQISIQQNL